VVEIGGEKLFVLHFIQCRDPEMVNKPFFARYDPEAVWLTDLRPAFGAERFPFEGMALGGDTSAHDLAAAGPSV
jgi:hypothetical protein